MSEVATKDTTLEMPVAFAMQMPQPMHDALRKEAFVKRMSMAEIVRRALYSYLGMANANHADAD